MLFSKTLRSYMDAASLNATQLANSAGLSLSSVSRYLSAKQTPSDDVVRKLATALADALSQDKATGKDAPSKEEIYSKLHRASSGIESDYESCLDNLKDILKALNVSNSELARHLAYDPSYISRILSGSRKPSDLPQFLSDVSSYLGRKYFDSAQASSILSTIDHQAPVANAQELTSLILNWLGQPHADKTPQIAHFLDSLDDFDLNDFLASIHFDDINVPTLPFQRHSTKTYTGIKEMMRAELDFIKYAVLSKSMEDVILYSDMPLEEMSKDEDFAKKWMMGMALMIRKGLHLHMIHDVHRPLPEMLLGLEGWIPMYMTGQVHPYYLPDQTNQHFMHFMRSAGSVAISGEAIYGKQKHGRYTVSRNKDDVAYYRQRAKDLLHRASPLMEIYKEERIDAFKKAFSERIKESATLHSLSNLPPLFTMSEELFESILSHNDVPVEEAVRIRKHYYKIREYGVSALKSSKFLLELSEVTHEDYEDHPARLPVSEIFPVCDIRYTEEEYRQHIKEAGEFAAENPNFSISVNAMPAFRNIDINIAPGRAVLVSKSNPPIIHFLILHPRLISAFEQFAPPIYEL